MMTLTELLEQTKTLSAQERKQLVRLLVDSLDVAEAPRRQRSILELRGLGKKIWEGIDVQEYVTRSGTSGVSTPEHQ